MKELLTLIMTVLINHVDSSLSARFTCVSIDWSLIVKLSEN
jgi:hypothetical protein